MPDFTMNAPDPILRENVTKLSTEIAGLCANNDLNTIYNSLMTVTMDVANHTNSREVAICFVTMCLDTLKKKPKMDG